MERKKALEDIPAPSKPNNRPTSYKEAYGRSFWYIDSSLLNKKSMIKSANQAVEKENRTKN